MKIARLPHYMKRFKELDLAKQQKFYTSYKAFFEQYAQYQTDQKKLR